MTKQKKKAAAEGAASGSQEGSVLEGIIYSTFSFYSHSFFVENHSRFIFVSS